MNKADFASLVFYELYFKKKLIYYSNNIVKLRYSTKIIAVVWLAMASIKTSAN